MDDHKTHVRLARYYLGVRGTGPNLKNALSLYGVSGSIDVAFWVILLAVSYQSHPIIAAFSGGILYSKVFRFCWVVRQWQSTWPFFREAFDWEKVKAYVENDDAGVKSAHGSGSF